MTGGFKAHDRGKLVMACGTGKTFAALRIAEAVAGVGGRVLYLVPSISLFQQSMREWATQQSDPAPLYRDLLRYACRTNYDEDASLQELEIPVTTDPSTISRALRLPQVRTRSPWSFAPTTRSVSWSARKTTEHRRSILSFATKPIERPASSSPGDPTSPFVLVHDAQRIRAAKAPLHDRHAAPLHGRRQGEGGKPRG